MPEPNRYVRFLLRGSLLLIGLLILWRFVLLDPMLFLLRGSVEFCGGMVFGGDSRELVTETEAGDWSVHVPMKFKANHPPDGSAAAEFSSIDFDIPRLDVISFTFSLPVFWALALAVPGIRQSVRPLIIGSAVLIILEILMLLLFLQISAHHAAAQFGSSDGNSSRWLLRFGDYLVVNVVPYAAPFVVAICVHPVLRGYVFPWPVGERHARSVGGLKTRQATKVRMPNKSK